MGRDDGGGVGVFAVVVQLADAVVSKVTQPIQRFREAVTSDRHVNASARVGLNQLHEGLKPLPDAVPSHDPGALYGPSQGGALPTRNMASNGQLPKPSDRAKDRKPYRPEQSNGQDRGRSRGRE